MRLIVYACTACRAAKIVPEGDDDVVAGAKCGIVYDKTPGTPHDDCRGHLECIGHFMAGGVL